MAEAKDWRHDGVQVIPGSSLDPRTAQTPGMAPANAIDPAAAGAK